MSEEKFQDSKRGRGMPRDDETSGTDASTKILNHMPPDARTSDRRGLASDPGPAPFEEDTAEKLKAKIPDFVHGHGKAGDKDPHDKALQPQAVITGK